MERLKALLEQYRCKDDCAALSSAELAELRDELTQARASLIEKQDENDLDLIKQYKVAITAVTNDIDAAKAAFEAKVAEAEEAITFSAAEEAASEDDAEADAGEAKDDSIDLSDFSLDTATGDAEEAVEDEVQGKVIVASGFNDDGSRVFDGQVKNSVELTKVLQAGISRFGNMEGRINLIKGVYDNENHVVLSGDSAEGNTFQMMQAVKNWEAKQQDHVDRQGLTADGGFCAPVTPDLSFCDLADSNLDLFQASLPSVRTIRGRVQYMETPTQDQFYDKWEGINNDTFEGVGTLFTETDSLAVDPADEDTWKQCVFVDCPEQGPVAELAAHYTCLEYAHFTAKAYPEYIDLYTRKALQAHQIKDSLALLSGVLAVAESVENISAVPGNVAGLFNALDIQATAYREAFWLSRTQVLDIVLPRWVLNMLRAALARRADANEIAALQVADNTINALFANYNLRVNFVTGWQRLATSTDGEGATTTPIRPAAGVNKWPDSFQAMMWVPGSVVLLEDPSWNIGIERIRDTRLQRRNAYSLFTETFNGLAYPCPYPVQTWDVEFCPTGASSARETLACTDLVNSLTSSS